MGIAGSVDDTVARGEVGLATIVVSGDVDTASVLGDIAVSVDIDDGWVA